jgi:glycosyltransferase involved in cell wall biosynthesis
MIAEITPLILTYNEGPNLKRTLERLSWAKKVILLDSGSTDETVSIAAGFPAVQVVRREFDNHTNQWNFGLDLVRSDWVLTLDADYVVEEDIADEFANLDATKGLVAYYARFRYCVCGRPLRAALYPPRAVLFRKDRCRYVPDGHTQRLEIRGNTGFLSSIIDHDDRKSVARWLWAQDRYAVLEAIKLDKADTSELKLPDRIRKKIVLAPALMFFHTLIGKKLIMDGWAGWYYVWQRTLAEMILSLRLTEQKLNRLK